MRLYEIVRPAFYISTQKTARGTKIERTASFYPLGADLEGCLEHRRPPECLPRDRSIYLGLEPPSGEFVYEVRPIGRVDRHHTSWLLRLQQANSDNPGEIDQLVHGYWSGVEYPEMRDAPWEYRALAVKVLKREEPLKSR